MTEMLTQLTISVQGKKGAGKTQFAIQVIETATNILGGAVVQNRDDKTGVYVTISLPMGALDPATAKIGPVAKTGGAPVTRQLFELSPGDHSAVAALIDDRARLERILKSDDPVGAQLVQMPDFMERNAVNLLVQQCAVREAARLDADLARLGFRFVERSQS